MELGHPSAREHVFERLPRLPGGYRARERPCLSTHGTGSPRRRGSCAPLASILSLLCASCGGAAPAAPSTGASQGEIAAGAVFTAIAAGTLWVVGGGCRLQGCPYGSYCNQKTGFCDVRRCDQGCPEATVCNEGLGRCQAIAPAAVPNDFLPQDDVRFPPGN